MQKDIQKKRVSARAATVRVDEAICESIDTHPAEEVATSPHSASPLMQNIDTNHARKLFSFSALAYRMTILCAILISPYVAVNIYQELHSRFFVDNLVGQIAKIAAVPRGEVPVVYSVDDPQTLAKDNPFFSGVKKNDKIIYYEKAGQVVVYDISQKKIIAMLNTALR
jgi:hypothetical protein